MRKTPTGRSAADVEKCGHRRQPGRLRLGAGIHGPSSILAESPAEFFIPPRKIIRRKVTTSCRLKQVEEDDRSGDQHQQAQSCRHPGMRQGNAVLEAFANPMVVQRAGGDEQDAAAHHDQA